MENYTKYVNPTLMAYVENEIVSNTAEIQRSFMRIDINANRTALFLNAIIHQSIPDDLDLYFYNKTMKEVKINIVKQLHIKIFHLIKVIMITKYKIPKEGYEKISIDIKKLISDAKPKNSEESLMVITNILIKTAYEKEYDASNFKFDNQNKFYTSVLDKLSKNDNFAEISRMLFIYLTTLISFKQVKISIIKLFGHLSYDDLHDDIFDFYNRVSGQSEIFEEKIVYTFVAHIENTQTIITGGYIDYISKLYEKTVSISFENFLKNDKAVDLISKEREIIVENIQGRYLTYIMTHKFTREEIYIHLAIDNYNNDLFDSEYNILKNTIELFFSLKENSGVDKYIVQSMLKNHIISFELNEEIHHFEDKIEISKLTPESIKKTIMSLQQDEYVQEAMELSKKINSGKKPVDENSISFYAPSFEKKVDGRYHHITKIFSNWKKWYIFSLHHKYFNIKIETIDNIFYEILFNIFKHFFQSLIFFSENPEFYSSFKNVFFYFVNDNPNVRYYTKDPVSSILHLFKTQLLVIQNLYKSSGFIFNTISEQNIFNSIRFGIRKLSDFILHYNFTLDGFTGEDSVTFMDLLMNETLDLVDSNNVATKNTYIAVLDYLKTFTYVIKISNHIYESIVHTKEIMLENRVESGNIHGNDPTGDALMSSTDNDLRYNFPVVIEENFFIYLNFVIDKNNIKELTDVSYTSFENKIANAIKNDNDKMLFHRYKDLLNSEKVQNTFIEKKPSKSDDVNITMEEIMHDDDDEPVKNMKIKPIDEESNSKINKKITIMQMLKYLHKEHGEDIEYIVEMAITNIKIYKDDSSLYYSRVKEIKSVLNELKRKAGGFDEHDFLKAIEKSKEEKYSNITKKLKKYNYSQTILNSSIERRESYRKMIYYDNNTLQDLQADFDMNSDNRTMSDTEFETISSVLENKKSLKSMIIEQKKVLEHLFDFTFNHNNLITFFNFYNEKLSLLVNKSRYKIKKLNFVDNFYSERKISIDIVRLLNIIYVLMFENKNINLENINNYFNDFNSNIINDEVYLLQEEQIGYVVNTTKDEYSGREVHEVKLDDSNKTVFVAKNKFINLTFMNKYYAVILRGEYKNQQCVIHKYVRSEKIPEEVLINVGRLKDEIEENIRLNEKIMYSDNLTSENIEFDDIDYRKMYKARVMFISGKKMAGDKNKTILQYEKEIKSKKLLTKYNYDIQIFKETIIENKIKTLHKKLDSMTELLRKKNQRNNKFVVTINYGTIEQKNIYISSRDLKFATEESDEKDEEINLDPFKIEKDTSLYKLIEYIYNNLYVINEDTDMNVEYKDFYNFILEEIIIIINDYKEKIIDKHKIYKKNKDKLVRIKNTIKKINNNEITASESILDKLMDNVAALNLKLSQYDSFKEIQEDIVKLFRSDFETVKESDDLYYSIIDTANMKESIRRADLKRVALNNLKYNESMIIVEQEQDSLLKRATSKLFEKFEIKK